MRRRGLSLDTLAPQYFRHRILRYLGAYIEAREAAFEYTLYVALRRVLFARYLSGYDRIIEFGSGTGTSLLMLALMYPGVHLTGCDWARPSQELAALVAVETGVRVDGVNFDMATLRGKDDIGTAGGAAVITLHALEQLGTGFGGFLDYLASLEPGLCLHLEPIADFYDPAAKFDRVAFEYHNKHKYLSWFLDNLRGREKSGDLEIVAARRLGFGSTYHEAYSLIIWRPLIRA